MPTSRRCCRAGPACSSCSSPCSPARFRRLRRTGGPWRRVSRGLAAAVAGALLRHYLSHPQQGAAGLRSRLERALALGPTAQGGAAAPSAERRFNLDRSGLPQTEESVAVCRSDRSVVFGTTNDFRLLSRTADFTGWELSSDGGASVRNEGLTPTVGGLISSGDSVAAADDGCGLYVADLNGDPIGLVAGRNGVGVYASPAARLAACPGGTAPSCWAQSRVVATNQQDHGLDQPWMDVGASGAAGRVVWVAYTDFSCPGGQPPAAAPRPARSWRSAAAPTSAAAPRRSP